MAFWMTLWKIVISAAIVGFLGLLVFITGGAIRELRMTLDELKSDEPS